MIESKSVIEALYLRNFVPTEDESVFVRSYGSTSDDRRVRVRMGIDHSILISVMTGNDVGLWSTSLSGEFDFAVFLISLETALETAFAASQAAKGHYTPDSWDVYASSGEYRVDALGISGAYASFVLNNPDDLVHAIVVTEMQPPLIIDPNWEG
jgi:hypothetical protein